MAGTRAGSVWYEKVEQIGEGTYGQVYRARHRVSGKVVALKKIRVHNEHNGLPLTAIREIKILKELSHPNMVELLEVVTSGGQEDEEEEEAAAAADAKGGAVVRTDRGRRGSLFLVLEYVDHDLAGLLDMHYCFSPQAIKMIIKQLLEVLQHMHEHRYVHRDIKCSNILLDNHHRLKLADFGLARRLCEDQDRQLSNKVITLWYRPPELLLGARRYGPPVDMWGVGCILSELILQKPLLPGKVELEQLEMIFKVVGTPTESAWPGHAELPLWQEMQPPVVYPNVLKSHLLETARKMGTHSSMTPEAVDLIARLMTLDPQRRMSAKTALEGRYFITPPRCPDDCGELGDLQTPGGSYHEFQTKHRKKENAKVKLDAGGGGGSARSSPPAPPRTASDLQSAPSSAHSAPHHSMVKQEPQLELKQEMEPAPPDVKCEERSEDNDVDMDLDGSGDDAAGRGHGSHTRHHSRARNGVKRSPPSPAPPAAAPPPPPPPPLSTAAAAAAAAAAASSVKSEGSGATAHGRSSDGRKRGRNGEEGRGGGGARVARIGGAQWAVMARRREAACGCEERAAAAQGPFCRQQW